MRKRLKRGYSLFLSVLLLINTLLLNTVSAVEFEAQKDVEVTSIGGIISNDTILELEKSPYILTEDMQIAYGATLTIEPGVVINGDCSSIKIWGTLNAAGTEENKIIFNYVNIDLNGKSEEHSFMDISFAIENWASYNSSETIVEYNSFMSTDRVALSLPVDTIMLRRQL